MGDGLKRAYAAAGRTRLSDDDLTILRFLVTQPDGVRPIWVSEHYGHWYKPEWANTRLRRYCRLGLVANPSKGWYVITDAGRDAAKQ